MWQPPRDTRGVWSGTRECSWVWRVAQGAVEERDQDTIGVGHVRVLGTEPGVPYILPLVRGGSQVGGRAQRGPSIEKGGLPPGLRAPGKGGGVGGGISSA